jgi:Zn finger protein HypA/HybF involved in hydrogenase expression
MPTIREIVRRHMDEYTTRYGETMPPWHRQALHAVAACRTPAMGGHLLECGDCGHREYVYHSCRSRACPSCHGGETAAWLAARAAELLPVRYFHVVFTVPEALREPLRRNQTALCGALMRAAAEAVRELAGNPEYLGAVPGVLAVLHTWGRTLVWHPHVHCLVTAGGTTPDGTWRDAPNPAFLVPVHALGAVFRGRFAALARAAAPDTTLPGDAFAPGAKWVVHAKPCLAGANKVVEYLGRYIHRLPVSDTSIQAATDEAVTFRYRDTATGEKRPLTLPSMEFLRRSLQHVPPPGFHRIRYYGLWSPAARGRLRRAMLLLAAVRIALSAAICAAAEFAQAAHQAVVTCRCPNCQSRNVRTLARFRPGEHGPP